MNTGFQNRSNGRKLESNIWEMVIAIYMVFRPFI